MASSGTPGLERRTTRRSKKLVSSAEIEELRALLEEVIRLRRNVKHAETSSAGKIDAVRPRHRESALNLVRYAELRRHDIRTDPTWS
ncbi:hypothetical protein [Arthrobacter sp. Leaf69]|uniref:hypothetical protein n=1 Tax=Arthrobacter sp. Leaf69 TaxID=1736232 RepID=UPI00138F1ABE|nr:hypothetical protein [Arthrobacter sp. Leaf69]